MTRPEGSIQGLCSAGATCFALSVAFLGVWGFQGSGAWEARHLLVLVPLFAACLSFALTPFVATRNDASTDTARRFYVAGVLLLVLAVAAAIAIAYKSPAATA